MSSLLTRRILLRRMTVASIGLASTGIFTSCAGVGKPTPAVVKVEYWHSWSNPPIIKAVADAAAEYNAQHPGQEVIARWGIPMTRMLLAVAGGQPPDVVTLYPGGTLSEWANNGALRSLTPFVQSSHYDLTRFVQSQITHAIFNGQLYALPLGMGAYMLYYNRKIFESAGVAGPPQTLQEAQQISQKLTEKTLGGFTRVGFLPFAGFSGNGSGFSLYSYLFGGKIWSVKKQRFTIDTPANLAALRWLTDYYHTYGPTAVDKFTAGFGSQAQDPFFASKLAMEINGQWQVFNAKNFKPDLEYDVAPIPYDEQHPQLRNSTMTRGNSLVLPKGSQHGEEGWSFITWMQTGNAPVTMAKAVNNMPAVKSYLSDPRLTSIDPRYARFLAYLRSGNVEPQWPPTPVTGILPSAFQTDVDAATHGAESPQQALAHIELVMQENLAEMQRRSKAT